jgi:lysozyme
MSKIPATRPKLTSEQLKELLEDFKIDRNKYPLIVIGIRGYYLNSMGKMGENDRGIYDDAIIIDSPNAMITYNGNVDPSGYRKGSGKGAGKGMASLKPGLYFAHNIGTHKGYRALSQGRGEVTVIRDGDPPYEDKGYFGINIHKGGINTTSSEGCQTIPPSQWNNFIQTVESEARRLYGDNWNKQVIPYVLIVN